MASIRPLAHVALGLAAALLAAGCGSDEEPSPQPDLDQAQLAARMLVTADTATARAQRVLGADPSAPRLGAVANELDDAAAFVAKTAGHVREAIDAAEDEGGEAGRQALEAADRSGRAAVDAGNRAVEALIDAPGQLGVPYERLVSEETQLALVDASEAINEAYTEVVSARARAE